MNGIDKSICGVLIGSTMRVSYRKMDHFCVSFATTNMGSTILAMDLVKETKFIYHLNQFNSYM